MSHEDIRHSREIGGHHRKEECRIELLGERRKSCYIREKDAHFFLFSSEFDIASHIRDLLDDDGIDIVREILLQFAPLAIDDEESIDECDRKREETHGEHDGKDIKNDSPCSIHIPSKPDREEERNDGQKWGKYMRNEKIE